MKIGVILVIFILFSLNVFADDFNLQISNEDNIITLIWNNIFYEEIEYEIPTIPGDDVSLAPEESIMGSEITTGAVVDGFFSNIFSNIVNVFRNLFGLNPVGTDMGKGYIIHKYNPEKIEFIRGDLNYFNCEITCSYTYTEEINGDYTYTITSVSGRDSEKSTESESITIGTDLECDEDNPCEDGYECDENECVVVEPDSGDELNCAEDGSCPPSHTCNIETNICIEDEVSLECENGAEETKPCNFDIGICQKPGIEKRICVEGVWGEFGGCDIPEEIKCSETNNNCESEMCDLDTSSCMPVEFEMEETVCNDNLDTDCDGLIDCEDDDCNPFPECVENNSNLETPCEVNGDCELDEECINGICFPLEDLGCEFDEECEINEKCENSICVIDESFALGDTFSEAGSSEGSSSRDVTGRSQVDDYDNYYPEDYESDLSLWIWLIIFVVLLGGGITGIWFYFFKWKK